MGGKKKILHIARGELDENAVWFMRQAGRYLPDYESLKGGRAFTDVLKSPDSIIDMSVLPLKYFDPDGIVVFTDILLPYTRMGYRLSYEGGISIKQSNSEEPDYYNSLANALKTVSELNSEKTVIGVVGGPFTTLSYLYDNGMNGYAKTKEMIASGERGVLEELTEEIVSFAEVQVKSGVDVVQIFDSWLGGVSENFYVKHLMSNESYFVEKIRELGKPVIFFSEGTSHLFPSLLDLKPDVFSLDWKMSLGKFKNICKNCIVQGNLDPYLLNSEDEYLRSETIRIMNEGKGYRGHVFNLGHGVPPWTDWKKLALVEREVHGFER